MNIDTVAVVSALVGLFFGTIIGTGFGIRDEAKRARAKWETLINSAMANAYQAGWVDAKAENKKRPSGNK